MKLLIMQFSPISCYFISLRPRYSSQTPAVYVPPLMSETKFRTHTEPQVRHSNTDSYSLDAQMVPVPAHQAYKHATNSINVYV
jgi:hypothetical protein